jgi:hypothetical protein
MELEQQQHSTPEYFLQKLHERELDLIVPLKKSGERGVIGETAGRGLKLKPSNIYWTGLRTFDMLPYPNLSFHDHIKIAYDVNQGLSTQPALGRRKDDDQTGDDSDAYQSLRPSGAWRCLPTPKDEDWREHVTIHLTNEEAAYLKDRINRARLTRNSLFKYLVNQDFKKIQEIGDIKDLERVFKIPALIRPIYDMAMGFSDFIYGATLRYNVILTEHENKEILEDWETWRGSKFVKLFFAKYNPNAAVDTLKVNNPPLRKFLQQWKDIYQSGKIKDMDDLIIRREIEIKHERAKLRSQSLYGGGRRGAKLNYRYDKARMILEDIYHGLKE